MSTLPGPKTQEADPNSLEKKVYDIVEKFASNIPVQNDRYRLGYTLFKYMSGEGDSPEILVNSKKIQIEGITKAELDASLNEELGKIE